MIRQCLRTLPVGLCLPLASCFTMGLWGFSQETERNVITGQEETAFEYDDDTEWSLGLFGLRVLLTPVTIVLDCVTAPVQAFLFDDDDDCSTQ